MLDKIKKKKAELQTLKPFSKDFKGIYDNINLLDLAYMNLKLDGSNLTKEGVNKISRGGVIDTVSLMEHQEIERYKDILKEFDNMLEMDVDLDHKQLVRLYKILTDNDYAQYRKSGTMLYHLDYLPPHSSEIEESLNDIFRQVFHTDFQGNFIRKALFIHNKIIEVYPFESKNESIARIAMEYELAKWGMPVVPFELTESQYNEMLAEYIKTEDIASLYDNLTESAIKKIDILLSLIKSE